MLVTISTKIYISLIILFILIGMYVAVYAQNENISLTQEQEKQKILDKTKESESIDRINYLKAISQHNRKILNEISKED